MNIYSYVLLITCTIIYDTVNCTCDINVDNEVNNMLQTVCSGPSTAPCVCPGVDCKVGGVEAFLL